MPYRVPAISVDIMYNLLIWRILKILCNLKVTDIIVHSYNILPFLFHKYVFFS